VPISAENIPELKKFALEKRIDLTVVGPEAPLMSGIVDQFESTGLRIFGPTKTAAQLEASKSFAKEVMRTRHVPTADFRVFRDPEKAADYLRSVNPPVVVKADGIAAGKGVTVARDRETAEAAVRQCLVEHIFGDAGDTILIEECLEGEEASILAFTDGETVVPMVSSQDHKPVYDNDEGPNTGGMGAYSPAPVVSDRMDAEIFDSMMIPVVEAMADRGVPYRGVLYAGLMITRQGPEALEFNVRFGDPETQATLPRLKSDIVPVLMACTEQGQLAKMKLQWLPDACVTVVMVSGGYPGSYKKGFAIEGLDEAESRDGVVVFHAGTAIKDSRIVTAGGRVLGVTAVGPDIPAAIDRAYAAVRDIRFEDMHYRNDIGAKALARLSRRR
jgi:phosphoribosylamine--glycine ligase